MRSRRPAHGSNEAHGVLKSYCRSRITAPGQQAYDHRGRADAVIQSLRAGGIDIRQIVGGTPCRIAIFSAWKPRQGWPFAVERTECRTGRHSAPLCRAPPRTSARSSARSARDGGVSWSRRRTYRQSDVQLFSAFDAKAWDEEARARDQPGSRPVPSPSRMRACRPPGRPDNGCTSRSFN